MNSHRGRSILGMLLILSSWMPTHQALGDTPEETYTATLEMEYATAYSSQRSCVVTYNDSIYYAFVDDGYRTRIAKKTPDGTVTETVIFDDTMEDGHNGPSVGIDRDGYIHVAGNMHHSPYSFPDNGNPYYEYAWQYVVSDRPEDISSFTFVGSDSSRTIPGTSITYPFFGRDNNGVLFVSFRIRVRTGGWEPGDLGAAIARYDVDKKSWTMLGGTDYLHGTKIFFWNNSGVDGAYQPYGPHLRFDRANRLHIAWAADDGTGRSGGHFTHVLYAYTDDGGESFFRADGTVHDSLPITLQTADIVAGPSFGNTVDGFSFRPCTDVTADGLPVVVIPTERTSGECNYMSIFASESGWSTPKAYPSSYRGKLIIDSNGVMTTVGVENGRPGLSRSFDNGETWQSYPLIEAQGHSVAFDYLYMDQTNQIRYQDRTGSTGLSKVWTIAFSGTNPPEPDTDLAADCEDRDKDGYGVSADNCDNAEVDCDDEDETVHPKAQEFCNNVDDNCDGEVDEGFELSSDSNNCGSCGNSCADDESCREGVCEAVEVDDSVDDTEPTDTDIAVSDSENDSGSRGESRDAGQSDEQSGATPDESSDAPVGETCSDGQCAAADNDRVDKKGSCGCQVLGGNAPGGYWGMVFGLLLLTIGKLLCKSKLLRALVLVVLVVVAWPLLSYADVYYVDADAPNDDGSGTIDNPWKSIAKVQSVVVPGDVVYFDGSDTWSYVDGQSILTAKGGVTYIGDEWGDGTRARLLLTADMHSEGSGIVQISTDHPTNETVVKGFELDGNHHVCNGFDMKKSTTAPLLGAIKRIENCYIHDTLASNSSHRALAVGSVKNRNLQNVEIINNTLSDSPRSGINFYNQIDCSTCKTSRVLIQGNTVYGSGYTGDGAGAGIILKNWTTDCTIERNVLFGNKNRGIAFDADGAPGAQNVIIRHNIIYDNAKGGIYFQHAGDKEARIYGNLIFENRDEGSGGTGIYFESNLEGNISATIYNNTIYHNANGGILLASSGATFTTLDIRNNIISSASGKYPYRDVSGGNVTAHFNNVYYRPDGGVLVRDGSSSFDAAALPSFEPTAMFSDPLFENVSDLPDGFTLAGLPNTSRLNILQGSPARDTGADLGDAYSVSINGLTRPEGASWDIGAYEYNETVCGDGVCDAEEHCGSCPDDCLEMGQVCCGQEAFAGDCCEDSDCDAGNACREHLCGAAIEEPMDDAGNGERDAGYGNDASTADTELSDKDSTASDSMNNLDSGAELNNARESDEKSGANQGELSDVSVDESFADGPRVTSDSDEGDKSSSCGCHVIGGNTPGGRWGMSLGLVLLVIQIVNKKYKTRRGPSHGVIRCS